MLPGCCKNGIVISKIPVMQAGLKEVMRTHFPEYEIISSASAEDLTLLQLRRSGLIIADLAGESEDPRSVCEHYYSLISQYREIHWVFMVSRSWYSQAVELLMCPTATLLSDVEPIENLVKTVRSGNTHAERISAMLTSPAMTETHDFSYRSVILTLSERKVLRLLGKGWGINQIASLLKKSNKTISAQKNSAMRRLAIHSNAEMYAWINSAQGARELNLPSVYGDAAEWNTAELRREILRFMSRGYSMTQIAEQLKRNIKTIRAHKFNVMSKLGVSSDAGLLEAADILLCMRHCEASNVLHPY